MIFQRRTLAPLLGLLSMFVGRTILAVSAAGMDAFGINNMYSSDPAKSTHDWLNKWSGSERNLERAGEADPQDSQTVMKGRSSDGITIGSGECVHHPGIPRLFINQAASAPGFENIEFTAYANWMNGGSETSNAGFTMIGRSDHFSYKENGCNAVGYYMRIWEGSNKEGQISFQKEYYHGDGTVYSSGIYTDVFDDFPKDQWIGMKFVIFTIPGTENVQLELYIDLTDGQSGGDWKLEHAYVDRPGGWEAKKSVPSKCPVGSGDTILGERNSCALRTDGGEVHWKKASVRHILPEDNGSAPTPTPPTPTATPPPTPTVAVPAPTPNTGGWAVITSDDFETGWGSYADGGGDSKLYTDGTFAHQGNNAVEIRDNRGEDSSITHISEHDVSAFSQLRVSFWFIADDMDGDEDFWLQYSIDGGSQWVTEKVWIHGVDFENGPFYLEQVVIDSTLMNAIKLRFRCDASNNNDSVYIDEIEFEGK